MKYLLAILLGIVITIGGAYGIVFLEKTDNISIELCGVLFCGWIALAPTLVVTKLLTKLFKSVEWDKELFSLF